MRIIDIAVEFPLNPKMKQFHLTLLLCLLLASSATGHYNSDTFLGHRLTGHQLGTKQTDLGSYGLSPDAHAFGGFGQQSNARLYSSGRRASVPATNNLGQFSQQITGLSTSGQTSYPQQPARTTVNQQPAATEDVTSFVSNVQVPQRDQPYSDVNNDGLSNGDSNKYNRPYAEPTGMPYGIQSTGEILSYQPEKLDLSKCGPTPTVNPCTPFGSQYYPLPGYPNCYIHCAFGRLFVKPCPTYLVWNTRVHSCDWPTLGSPFGSDDYGTTSYSNSGSKSGSASYETSNTNYAMPQTYSYGRKKRSTIERKKRNIAAYYQSLMMPFSPQQYPGYYTAPSPYEPDPLRIPVTQFNLPGPVSFPGQVGFASFPSQFANPQAPQPVGVPLTAPAASAPVPVAQATPAPVPVTPATPAPVPVAPMAPSYAPVAQPRTIATYGGLYADMFTAPSKANPAVVPAAPSAALTPTFFPTLPSAAFSSSMFPQQSVAPATSFAAPTPVSFSATLIPGPLYPYGPPHGGPFGHPLPPPPKPSAGLPPMFFGPFAGHPMARFGFFGGQALPPFMPFGGQPLSSFRFFGGQQPPPAMPFGGQGLPPFMPIADLFRGGSFGSNLPNNGPLGSDFELEVFSADDDSNEGSDDSSSGKGDGRTAGKVNKNENKISDKSNSGKSPSTDGGSDYSKRKDYTRNGNFKSRGNKVTGDNYEDEEFDGYDDFPNIYYRKKRHYGSYGTTVGQVPTVPVAALQQYQTSYNPLQSTSYNALQQPRLIPNELNRQPSLQLSPCFNKPPRINIAHPTDAGKYIACISRLHYEIMDCPSGLIYNPTIDQCEKRKNLEAICEREKPCMNNGQCYQTSPTIYKCTCRGAWTGERCETPLSSCATNPCGPGNECLTLKAGEYKQDYVCVCDEGQAYGLSCGRNTVPNPCLGASTEQEQYYPFIFSPQAFIQCNGEILYVQPCASGLYWNQEEKVCDQIEMLPTTPGEKQPQSYEVIYGTNEQKSTYIRPTPNLTDQNFIKQQSSQQRFEQTKQPQIVINEQSSTSVNKVVPVPQQPTVNSFQIFSRHMKQKSSMPTNNYVMAQEQPILTSRSSWSTPVIQSETAQTYLPKPQYDQTYNELSPRFLMHQQPIRPSTRLVRPELQGDFNTQ
ncbi:unnamed protein product [Rotaria sp. Silwood2]|nr:unnamed protein product [Rotaria sp. Silwood2]CAF2557819.1 unnamed protein product [Rotaria sp. Silwood2]CAF2972529.1 unnamed protein product [Rotaria sp. Silwood2]CAF4091988.1 unnamed protein product [Rotaria sp. Silwood2]CAF4107261.1 unnamed protein product [Rotaria sp. Silwood2]